MIANLNLMVYTETTGQRKHLMPLAGELNARFRLLEGETSFRKGTFGVLQYKNSTK